VIGYIIDGVPEGVPVDLAPAIGRRLDSGKRCDTKEIPVGRKVKSIWCASTKPGEKDEK